MFLKILMVVLFFIVTIAIGFLTKSRASNVEGFVLGGRKVGTGLSAFAYGTTYFSAVVFIGYAGQFGWKYGMAAVLIGLANAIIGCLMAWYVLGRRTRAMTRHLGVRTMPDFFGSRFDSKALRIVAAAIVFIFLTPYTASVYNGLSRLFFMAFDMPFEYAIIGMAVITCIFVVLGGYMATIVNDVVQGSIMLIGVVVVIAVVLNQHGGFTQAVVTLSQVPLDANAPEAIQGQQGAFTSLLGPDIKGLIGVLILTSLGTWGLPQMVGRFYAIKSISRIRIGAIIATVFAVIIAGGSYFLGGFGRLVADDVARQASGAPVYDSIIPTMLSNMPDLLIGLIIILVLSASISTLSALVLTSSSTLTLDFIKGNFIKKMTDRSQLISMRLLIVVFVVISAGIALYQYNSPVTFIAQLMGISWGALAGSFLGPFLYGLYWKRTTKAAVWASFIFAIGLTCSNMAFSFFTSPINAGAAAMIGSLIIVPLVSWISPKPDMAKVDEIFEKSYKDLNLKPVDLEE